MVSDSELIEKLRDLLRNSDLETTTTGGVRRKLEEDFGIDLSEKKAFIREQVNLFLETEFENAAEHPDNGEEDEQMDYEETGGSVSKEDCGDDGAEPENDGEEGTSNVKGTSKGRFKKHSNEGKKRGGGFSKLCSLSPQLQEFVGVPELARTEVVKQLWAYIREKNLQDPSNRRNIICDEKLHAVFGIDSINMFQMNKALSKHIWPLDSDDVIPVKSAQKDKQRKQEREEEEPDKPKQKEKRQKVGKSGFLAPLQLSDALIKFLGTGESALSRADAVKRMWDYIKQNNLQDPSDKRRILCDEKLKELFDVDSFNGFTVSKLLSAHFVKS